MLAYANDRPVKGRHSCQPLECARFPEKPDLATLVYFYQTRDLIYLFNTTKHITSHELVTSPLSNRNFNLIVEEISGGFNYKELRLNFIQTKI